MSWWEGLFNDPKAHVSSYFVATSAALNWLNTFVGCEVFSHRSGICGRVATV